MNDPRDTGPVNAAAETDKDARINELEEALAAAMAILDGQRDMLRRLGASRAIRQQLENTFQALGQSLPAPSAGKRWGWDPERENRA